MSDPAASLVDLVAALRVAGVDTASVEVKASAQQLSKSIVETLSAFANGDGGLIILGLDEANGFTPVAGFHAERIREALAGACADRLQPPLRPVIAIEPFEDALVVVARVDSLRPHDKPCYVKDRGLYQGSFIRTGDGDRHLSHYEIDRLVEERRQPTWDEEAVTEASPDDLDPGLVQALVERQRATRPRLFGSGSTEDVLLRLKVLRRLDDGLHPSLAGLLALGTYPQYFFPRLNVTFAAFPGDSKAPVTTNGLRLLDSASLVGPIPALIEDAMAAVRRNSRTGATIEGAFRHDVPDYPPLAVREAVTNALMHRDLSPHARGSQVQVNLYADRLEILNPGGLYGVVTLAELGRAGVSASRNQLLSALLEEVPYPGGGMVAENRGSGYAMIQAALADSGAPPPVPRDAIAHFSLALYRRPDQPASVRPTTRDRVADIVRTTGPITARDIAGQLGLSRSAVVQHLRALAEAGQVSPTEPPHSRRQRYRWSA